MPDPDEAGPRAIAAYLGAYGPNYDRRLPRTAWPVAGSACAGGCAPGSRRSATGSLRSRWTASAGSILAEDVADLARTRPTKAVRLLGRVRPVRPRPRHRRSSTSWRPRAGRLVSKQSGWIAPVVVQAGVVTGTWELAGNVVQIAWFGESGAPPAAALAEEVARLGSLLGRTLEPAVTPI